MSTPWASARSFIAVPAATPKAYTTDGMEGYQAPATWSNASAVLRRAWLTVIADREPTEA